MEFMIMEREKADESSGENSVVMENSATMIGPKGMIKQHEFVRVIIQSLYSLGYRKSASCLESESGISYKSVDLELLESQIPEGNWNICIDTLNGIKELVDETRASALFLVFKQCMLECLSCGDDSLALAVLRKKVPALLGRENICNLAYSLLNLKKKDLSNLDENSIFEQRRRLLTELEKLLPPPTVLPERRLEHLVETAVTAQIDSCMYHNSQEEVSLYEDHCCTREQIPTETIQVMEGERLTFKRTLRSHQNPVSFVAWSPDDTKLLTCGNVEVLKLWDVETGTCKHTFGDHGFIVSSCAWFPDSKRLVCGSSDPEKGICMYDCDGNEIKAWRGTRMPKVLDLAVTPDGEHLISVFSDKDIRIFNLVTNAERVISEEHPITSLSVSINSKFFIVNLNSQEIHLWDVAGKWEKALRYKGHKQHKYVIRSCFGGLNSSFIASGSENSQVYIWNRRNPKPIEVLSGHLMTVNCVSWNPRRHQMLASASDDHTIRIWGPSQSKNIQHEKLI
ncbi:WD repeat-containing protein WDS homolog isoform X2 [Manihot esculenta]|uniref:Uncharacterized protein n=1 Tax=Manihot esculenta TaxID=3983 RepID=A0ACB7GND4_MANES|nr:WD repeat-containing protein WDS homolog isoform X2 [Manihot esculenta]KAG8641863.1 hypothetical protein MANES_12G039300v8 [Manihot esculenta]